MNSPLDKIHWHTVPVKPGQTQTLLYHHNQHIIT